MHTRQGVRRGRGKSVAVRALLCLVAALFLNAGCSRGGAERTGRVLHVIEGDLLKVEMDGRWVRLQLAGVDSPVRGQPYRGESRAFSARKVDRREIAVRVTGSGDAGHLEGEVLLPGGSTLNRELVAAGLAWARSTWLDPHPELERAQQRARRARRGLWRDPDPVAPWEFLGAKSWKSRDP